MGYINDTYPGRVLTGILLPVLLLFGCTGQQTVQKDPFFDKWTTMADTAAGHSPAPREKGSTVTRELLKATGETGEGLTVIPIKELPTQLVSLKFRQADIQTILRSLARIVGKNVLVKSEIKGEMTIDFRDVPWNQAFNSILRTQGLTYTWEGDILRVLTFEDLELDLKRKTQEMGVKWVEPLMTVVVPIDYAKPKDLKENLETFLTRSKEDKPRGSIRVDEHSNSLIISAIKDDLARMIPIIEISINRRPRSRSRPISSKHQRTQPGTSVSNGAACMAARSAITVFILPRGARRVRPRHRGAPCRGDIHPAPAPKGSAARASASISPSPPPP